MRKTIYQIAEEIDTSKQNVNQILKRALVKVYNGVKSVLGEKSKPFDVVVAMTEYFHLSSDRDVAHFFWELPEDIRRAVILDAKERVTVTDEDFNIDTFVRKNVNQILRVAEDMPPPNETIKTNNGRTVRYAQRNNFDAELSTTEA